MNDKTITLEDAKNALKQDIISRDDRLNLFLGMLNAVDTPSIISLDGAWGSGKTYFVKQIELIGQASDKEFESIKGVMANKMPNRDISNMLHFRNDFVPYYFNAWENDQADEPLQALLFSLINDIEEAKEGTNFRLECFKKGLRAFNFSEFLKDISHGFVDIERISELTDTRQLAKEYITARERCDAISEMLQKLVSDAGKKLLVIIDELDRCKPSFAVRLLEGIKHCCGSNNVVFLLATNNIQLVHTIKHFYGIDFDGAEYLNKFYDLQFDIGDVDVDSYIKYKLGDTNVFVSEVAKQLHMTMREMNRYITMISMVKNYIRYNSFGGMYAQENFCKTVIVPLALGLKVKRPNDFQQLYNGKGGDIIGNYIEHCGQDILFSISHILSNGGTTNTVENNDRNAIKERIIDIYNDIFSEGTQLNMMFREQFLEALTLISTVSSIPLDISRYQAN